MSSGRLPRVALVGRQNVGKSTLLNRLLGSRQAIAHETPGVTRDRIEAKVDWGGREFMVIDTGGYVRRATGIEALVAKQVERALEDADVIVLVVDAVTGPQDEDADLARRLRRAKVPVLLAGNKVDSQTQEPGVAELYRLGLGEPIGVSALHGRASGELLDRIVEVLPDEADIEEAAGESAFAIVGRPNVGKSSLLNRLAREERAVVSEVAGTTRDAVDTVIEWEGRPLRFVDTAGFRKPSRAENLEYYGYVRAVKAIDRSEIVALVLDASEGVTTEDRKIAARVAEAGRGLVAVANKWDLVEEKAQRFEEIGERLEVFPGVPVLRTSAHTGKGVDRVVPALLDVYANWLKRVATAQVNRVLEDAQGLQPAPRGGGRILYGTQVSSAPPRFVIFTTGDLTPVYKRFLENRLRDAFGFEGVPVRLSIRARGRK
ncbi:MAG TPA: ribosome biogenesis GTPase Der [Actinomycetota bacterium]